MRAAELLRNRRRDGSLKRSHAEALKLAARPGLERLADILIPLLPWKVHVAEGLKRGRPASWSESVRYAVEREYISLNSATHINAIVRDCDHDDLERWTSCGLPTPCYVVETPETGKHHVVWLLRTPVAVGPNARPGPQAYLKRVQQALDFELGGDPGYTMLLTKNPFSPRWKTHFLGGEPVDLKDLYEPISCAPETPRKRQREAAGGSLGRNCDLFDTLRLWAYDAVRKHADFSAWQGAVEAQAAALNGFAQPLPDREVAATARSVAKWVWNRYEPAQRDDGINRGVMRLAETDLPLKARQSLAGARSSDIVRGKTEQSLADAVEALLAAGERVSQSTVRKASGLSEKTVKRHWKFVRMVLDQVAGEGGSSAVYQVLPREGAVLGAREQVQEADLAEESLASGGSGSRSGPRPERSPKEETGRDGEENLGVWGAERSEPPTGGRRHGGRGSQGGPAAPQSRKQAHLGYDSRDPAASPLPTAA